MQNGWALQSGTSHFLGQNFAKAFDVYFQTEDNQRELVWATSWCVSTRLMSHECLLMTSDDTTNCLRPSGLALLCSAPAGMHLDVGARRDHAAHDRASRLVHYSHG